MGICSRRNGLLLAGAAYVCVSYSMVAVMASRPTFASFIGYWTILFLIFGMVVLLTTREGNHDLYPWILAIAVAVRIPFLGALPVLSDDIYRYLWDGHVTTHGINPFAYPPEAFELETLRTPWHPRINHPSVPTIYPPLAQLFFAGVYLLSPTITAFKVFFAAADVGCTAVLAGLLHKRGLPRSACSVYGLCPLAVIASAYSGHLDALGIFFMLSAIYLYLDRRESAGHPALAGSILIKVFPLALLPVVGLHARRRALLLMVPALIIVAYLPFMVGGGRPFAAMINYGRHWYFNAPLFRLMWQLVEDPLTARLILGLLFSGVVGYCTLKRYDIDFSAFAVAGAWLLLTTTLHPWYVLWVLPFLSYVKSKAFTFLTYGIGFSYYTVFRYLQQGVWLESTWIWIIEYIPFGVLLAVDLVGLWRRKGRRGRRI